MGQVSAVQWNFSIAIYLVSLFLVPLIYISARRFHFMLGGNVEEPQVKGPDVGIPILLLMQIYVVIAEEFGWRGLAQPALQGHVNVLIAALIVGVMWTFWHLPMFFVKDSNQYGTPIALYAFVTISFGLYAAVFYNASGGSVLPAMLFHMSLNIAAFTINLPKEAYTIIWIAFAVLDFIAILLLLDPVLLGAL